MSTRAPGSSPLTRGKPRPDRQLPRARRLIPAHAGKTRPQHPRRGPAGAHPRSRGENNEEGATPSVGQGSSPLTRGKRRAGELVLSGRGLIPAHAGKTEDFYSESERRRAHPRSRGENRVAARGAVNDAGSSPLTRGKRFQVGPGVVHAGLIPAHAGKTGSITRSRWPLRAHPRSRGENCSRGARIARSAGSSPLTRGKRQATPC